MIISNKFLFFLGYVESYDDDKHFGARAYAVNSEPDQIQAEIMNGPVEAAFTVYADFLSYKSGSYTSLQ